MLQTFLSILTPMAVMLFFMVSGFVAKKGNFLPDNTALVLSKMENYFIVPAMMISTFMQYCSVTSLKENGSLVLYSLFILAVALLLSYPLARLFERKDAYRRNIYKYLFFVGNFGFLGNAVVLDMFGSEVLYRYLLFTLPFQMMVNSWGIAIMIPSDKKQSGFLSNFKTPVFFGILIGVVLGLSGLGKYMPAFITQALSNFSSCMGPIAMFLSGFVMGGYGVKKMVANPKVCWTSFLRLLVLPVLLITILKFCGAGKEVLVFAMFVFATPTGMNTILFPTAYGGDPYPGASAAMVSNPLCVLTIPLLYSILMTF